MKKLSNTFDTLTKLNARRIERHMKGTIVTAEGIFNKYIDIYSMPSISGGKSFAIHNVREDKLVFAFNQQMAHAMMKEI